MVDSPNLGEEVGSVIDDSGASEDVVAKNAAVKPIIAPSPNTMRKRRHVEIAKKVEMRKALITTASSSRLDIGKVHSILSGPRLSWDASKSASLSMRGGGDGDEEDEVGCGLIVEDFHSDSRSALRTNISKALSQMASRDINTQQISENCSSQVDEEIQKIIQLKKRLIRKDDSKVTVASLGSIAAELDEDGIGENLPVLEPIEEERIIDQGETQEFVHRPVIEEDDAMSPTQIFQRQEESEEELDMDSLAMEPTQVYIPPRLEEPELVEVARVESKSSTGSSSALPPNTVREDVMDSSVDESSEEEPEEVAIPTEIPSQIKKRDQVEFAEWLAARKQKTKRRKEQGKDAARMFFEAEAEESEDEELGGIMRRKRGDDSDGSSPDSSSDEVDSDLEDLVASAADEFVLEKKSGKDSRKLAKLHAKWAEERDAALEKAIEDRDFMRRKQGGASRLMMDEGFEGGLNRMQRKLKARRDAMVEQFDREGNLLAPEYASDSDYDSMEIDSDDFFDEEDEEGERGEIDPAEREARQERKQRDQERRKTEMEFKMEMKKRRQMLKEKLRQERIMREKDKREIQSGVGIMNEEDREVFKMVNRSQVFGYTGKEGSSTQSTVASSTVSSQFSFLGGKPGHVAIGGRRRSSAVALELE